MYSNIYVPSLLCAELVWAELVMCRVGYVPSLLCAELTRHHTHTHTHTHKLNIPCDLLWTWRTRLTLFVNKWLSKAYRPTYHKSSWLGVCLAVPLFMVNKIILFYLHEYRTNSCVNRLDCSTWPRRTRTVENQFLSRQIHPCNPDHSSAC